MKIIRNTILVAFILLSAIIYNNIRPSVEDKQASFEAKIYMLNNIGFDVNKTNSNLYLLTVKEPKTVTSYLLSVIDMNTLDRQTFSQIKEAIDGARIGIEVDWQKYASSDNDSIFIYYLGNGKESENTKNILKAKKVGAYLTLDKDDRLKKADIKDIDEQIIGKMGIAHIYLRGASLNIDKTPTANSTKTSYILSENSLKVSFEDRNNTTNFGFSYDNLLCKVHKTNSYLGKWECKFPRTNMWASKKNYTKTITALVKDMQFKYDASVNNGKIKTSLYFMVPQIHINYKDMLSSTVTHIDNIKLLANADNIDEQLTKKLYDIASKIQSNRNKEFKRYMQLISEAMNMGITFGVDISLASVDSKITDSNKTIKLKLKDYHTKINGSLKQTINYNQSTQVGSIYIADNSSQKPILRVKKIKFAYSIKELYNFLPELVEFTAMVENKAPDQYQLTKEEDEKLETMAHKIINNGLNISLKPVSIDSMIINNDTDPIQIGKMKLAVDAKLAKNNLKLDTPLSIMVLMQYLHTNLRIKIDKKVLNMVLDSLPSKWMIAMAITYAKYDKDSVIFDIEFNQGQLVINNKPVVW